LLLLPLDVDDTLALAGEDGNIGPFGLARPVDDAAHDGDFYRCLDRFQLVANLLDEGDQVHLDPAAGGAGDELRLDAWAKTETVEHLPGVLDFKDGIGGIADADGVSDAVGEEGAEGGDGSDAAGFLRAGVGDAEVERIIVTLADGGVGVDDDFGIDRFGTDDNVVKIVLVEDVQVVVEFFEHDGDEVVFVG